MRALRPGLARGFLFGVPLSLGLWACIAGAVLLTWALFDTLSERAELPRMPGRGW